MPATRSASSVLFVCTGNICRSPTAQALLLHKAAARGLRLHVDSAAVSGEELGHRPDPRALAELRRRGIVMPAHRARRVQPEDFLRFDLLLGMTAHHVRALQRLAPAHSAKVDLLMHHAQGQPAGDVPDPWSGDAQDFVRAFDLIETGVDGLLQHLTARHAG